jgi:hypothetical protein
MRGQDTFTRANQSGSFGIASNGQSWTTLDAGTLSIASNEGVIVSNGADTHVQLGSQTGTDMIVLCRIAINNAADICGVQARFAAANGTTCYKLLFYTGDIHINKAVAGTGTNLANFGGFTMTPGTFYLFKLACIASKVTGKVWQSGTAEPSGWNMSVTDTAITSGGFAILGQTNGGSTGVQFDNFSAVPFVPVVRAPSRSQRRVA